MHIHSKSMQVPDSKVLSPVNILYHSLNLTIVIQMQPKTKDTHCQHEQKISKNKMNFRKEKIVKEFMPSISWNANRRGRR